MKATVVVIIACSVYILPDTGDHHPGKVMYSHALLFIPTLNAIEVNVT